MFGHDYFSPELDEAIRANDIAKVEEVLEHEPERKIINVGFQSQRTLATAIENNCSLELIEKLIEKGAKVSRGYSWEYNDLLPALTLEKVTNRVDLFRLLLKNEAQVITDLSEFKEELISRICECKRGYYNHLSESFVQEDYNKIHSETKMPYDTIKFIKDLIQNPTQQVLIITYENEGKVVSMRYILNNCHSVHNTTIYEALECDYRRISSKQDFKDDLITPLVLSYDPKFAMDINLNPRITLIEENIPNNKLYKGKDIDENSAVKLMNPENGAEGVQGITPAYIVTTTYRMLFIAECLATRNIDEKRKAQFSDLLGLLIRYGVKLDHILKVTDLFFEEVNKIQSQNQQKMEARQAENQAISEGVIELQDREKRIKTNNEEIKTKTLKYIQECISNMNYKEGAVVGLLKSANTDNDPKKADWQKLPPEIGVKISKHLSIKDACRVAQTCRGANKIAKEEQEKKLNDLSTKVAEPQLQNLNVAGPSKQ